MNNIYSNLGNSLNNLSLKDEEKIFIYDEKNCIEKTTILDYYYINKFDIFLHNLCLININTKPYYCDECCKDIGYNDYLYYNKEYKYKITELYYHKIKSHGYKIDEKIKDII